MGSPIGAGWVIVGGSGTGKTACLAHMLSHKGLAITPMPQACKVMNTVYGVMPKRVVVTDLLEDAVKVIQKVKSSEVDCLLLDDAHYMIENYATRGDNFWDRMSKSLMTIGKLGSQLADKGVKVFVTVNEQPPRVSSGKRVRGGPLFPGQMPEKFCGLFHAVARMAPGDDAETTSGWRYWLDFGSDPEYIGKNRDLALSIKRYPPFVPEILRFGGVTIDLPLYGKHEKTIDKLAGLVLEEYAEDQEEVCSITREAFVGLAKKTNPREARGIVMAGLTRGALRHAELVL